MLIVRTAKREGDPRALFPSESEQSQYSRKWGSLYSTLKPAVYWFFILDYQWVVVRSGIIAFGQVVLPQCFSWKTNNWHRFIGRRDRSGISIGCSGLHHFSWYGFVLASIRLLMFPSVLLVKRPYGTIAATSLQLFLAGKRFVTTVLLLVFWDGFLVEVFVWLSLRESSNDI